ncbi:MAG: insulinase family protein [Phycisphaerae bacterium]|nr:insulinase family protein [Phycisphaerae bacterium]NIP54993.1 insulinase family protein [Phycisphaerae bacterium]NIS53708.1 insulinase family protein [Phycisphaerae bacterium]NIU11279.1 insulinase family protein [Phycisphaerae bacterium]NIU56936.1 insulinase family protein [Phycisphaerae bacterium]
MEFKKKILSNGLCLIGEVNKSAKSAAVGFFVKTGARDETLQINGVSHFLEHMLFKGTEKLNAFEVSEAFDKRGAEFNAATGEEYTIFYAKVLPEYLVEITELWIELMRPALRDEDFNIEKNVIKEEIAMYKDLPSFDVMDRCRNLYFDGHPCGNSILGSNESIDGLTAKQMRDYFTNRYAPNNIVLACAGNFDWSQISSVVEAGCGKWQKQDTGRELEDFPGSRKTERIEKTNLAREHICLMSPGVSAQDARRFAAILLGIVVGDDVGSRFFWELVDKALAEAASMQFGAMDGTGVFQSYIRCSSEKGTKVLDTIKDIFESLSKDGISEEELQKAKNKTLSALVIKNELPMGRLLDLGLNWTYLEEYRTIEDDINSIKGVTTDDVHSLIEQFDLGEFTQLSIGPEQNSG